MLFVWSVLVTAFRFYSIYVGAVVFALFAGLVRFLF